MFSIFIFPLLSDSLNSYRLTYSHIHLPFIFTHLFITLNFAFRVWTWFVAIGVYLAMTLATTFLGKFSLATLVRISLRLATIFCARWLSFKSCRRRNNRVIRVHPLAFYNDSLWLPPTHSPFPNRTLIMFLPFAIVSLAHYHFERWLRILIHQTRFPLISLSFTKGWQRTQRWEHMRGDEIS